MDRRPLVEDEVADWRFSGEDGLRRLAADVVIDVHDRPGFQARVVRAGFASVICIDEMTATPVHSVRVRADRGPRSELVALHLVVDGHYRAVGDAGSITVGPGDAAVVDSRVAVRFESSEPVRLLRVMTLRDELPPHLRERPPMPFGALPQTALLAAYRAFVRSVLQRATDEPERAPHLVHALKDLTFRVLTEASASGAHSRGAEGTRFRIKELVERRLADRSLTAVTIAAALGVSTRHVHQVFESEGVTISRYVEERRLRAAAADLRIRTAPARSTELAPRYGFGGADQLSRAFRRRYGVTLEEYRENSHLYRL